MGADDIGDKEELEREPTPAEIADACRELLDPFDPGACDEIAQAEDATEALMFAMTAICAYTDLDPEEFLISKGLLEKSDE